MNITLFSSNQPRHLNLARSLSKIADKIFFISEVNTIFPGETDDFFRKSEVMKTYFSNVIESEKKIFGEISFLPEKVKKLSIKSGDLNKLSKNILSEALNSDVYIIFGSSYIKGWLIDFLISKNALNIHMGISPYYRGSSCNFWALYDYNPSYVGATIHMLSKGLDNGDILFHCIPKIKKGDNCFDFTMKSVLAAHNGLINAINDKNIFSLPRRKQNKELQIRYSKNSDFTDEVALEFLSRDNSVENFDLNYTNLINPFFK